MDRRTFDAFVASLLAASLGTDAANAAQPVGANRRPRLGRLSEGAPIDFQAFRAAMRDLGHPDIAIEDRPARGQYDKLPELAAELVALEVDVIWAVGSGASAAAKNATQTIPIVIVSADAVGAKLVASLARPGGNLTGLTLVGTEIVGKRLELLTQLDPSIKRVIALSHGPGSAEVPFVAEWLRQSQAAAKTLRLVFKFVEVSTTDPKQWDGEFGLLAATPGTALSVMESPFFLEHQALLAELTLKHRLPAVFAFQQHVQAGGLLAYGVTGKYITERVAFYVARILGGAKPGGLPVEQPTKYELAVNLKSARAIGLVVPRSLLLRADTVIE